MYDVLIPVAPSVILDTLHQHGFAAYVVGGCVRDSLLGRTPKDWDVCTSATPNDVERCFSGHKIVETGIQHGTVTVFIGGAGIEVTTFRTEGEYSDHRRPDNVEFVSDVTLDLSRRDFTMNAMAYSNETGLIDPFHGEESIKSKTISCVGNPDERFQEDPLRIMRAIRFASDYGFAINAHTAMSIHRNAKLLEQISAERINSELCKILRGKDVLLTLLTYWDVLTVIIPELSDCIGFDQNNRFHQYDVYEHIVHSVANYTGDDDVVNVALLLHDIGKPRCYTENETGGHFYQHQIPSYSIALDVVSRLRFDGQNQHDIAELVLFHNDSIEPTPRAVKKWLNKLGEKQFFRLMDMRLADIMAHAEGTQESKIEKRNAIVKLAHEIIASNQCFTVKDLAINGTDVMADGIPQGPMVGAALKTALDGVINDKVPNEKQELLDYIQSYMDFIRNRTDVPVSETEPFCPFSFCGYCNAAYSDYCYICDEPRKEWCCDKDS